MDEQKSTASDIPKNLEAYKALLEINEQQTNLKAKTSHMKAYILSFTLPPIGLYYFFKCFFFGEGTGDDRKTAIICLILTVVPIVLSLWSVKFFFSQTMPLGTQNLDFLKEMITPENQKTLEKLLQ